MLHMRSLSYGFPAIKCPRARHPVALTGTGSTMSRGDASHDIPANLLAKGLGDGQGDAQTTELRITSHQLHTRLDAFLGRTLRAGLGPSPRCLPELAHLYSCERRFLKAVQFRLQVFLDALSSCLRTSLEKLLVADVEVSLGALALVRSTR